LTLHFIAYFPPAGKGVGCLRSTLLLITYFSTRPRLFSLQYFSDIYTESNKLVKFINNHHHTLAAWRKISDKTLLKLGETRFATCSIMLDRLAEVQVRSGGGA
jgi:hypothetical protein